MVRTLTLLLGITLLAALQCNKKDTPSPATTADSTFAKGADVSWLTQMEASGVNFYNAAGTQQDCFQILKNIGINSIRLRAWVNPPDGWNNTKDIVAKAVRAKNLGMKIMIDFHYSDTWADPGHQTKPAAWSSMTIDQLKTATYNYTKGVIDTLVMNGVTPTWVQIGNETNNGMLWPEGIVSQSNVNDFTNFAALITSGYTAVKAASSSTKVIVHLSNGYDNSLYQWMFDGLLSSGAQFDIIGMSLYPSYSGSNWSGVNAQCLTNMSSMLGRYAKPVMIVEVGWPVNDPVTANEFIADLIAKTKSIPGGNGLGVFYWEPECYNNWQGYGLGAFDNSGKPTSALAPFGVQ